MAKCVKCLNNIEEGYDATVVPHASSASPLYIHDQCLEESLEQLDTQETKMVEFLMDHEKQNNVNFEDWGRVASASYGWQPTDVPFGYHQLAKFVKLGILGISFKSNKSTCYALAGKDTIEKFLKNLKQRSIMAVEQEAVGIPDDLFSCIIGYDDVKQEMLHTITHGIRSHYLLVGPPATAKSLVLMEVSRIPNVYVATGSTVRGPGLTEALKTYQPRILVLDEADKIKMEALSVLLSVMETGLVTETKYHRHESVRVDTSVFAAANSTNNMAPEFLSRFGEGKLFFKPYSEEQFMEVCVGYLAKYESASPDIAHSIAYKTYFSLDRDVRTARGIARRIHAQTLAEVDRVVGFILKYKEKR